jgi:hypothetical protein
MGQVTNLHSQNHNIFENKFLRFFVFIFINMKLQHIFDMKD